MWNVFSIESEFFRFELEIWFIEMSFSVGAMANGRRMEYNYENAHNVGADTEKQAEKPIPEILSEFQSGFCISTQMYIYKDKKRMRHENKEHYI